MTSIVPDKIHLLLITVVAHYNENYIANIYPTNLPRLCQLDQAKHLKDNHSLIEKISIISMVKYYKIVLRKTIYSRQGKLKHVHIFIPSGKIKKFHTKTQQVMCLKPQERHD